MTRLADVPSRVRMIMNAPMPNAVQITARMMLSERVTGCLGDGYDRPSMRQLVNYTPPPTGGQ